MEIPEMDDRELERREWHVPGGELALPAATLLEA
jgi:hypothetical protein